MIYFLDGIIFEGVMKKFYLLSAIGLVLGNFVATYFGPSLLTWWFESPVNMAINCSEPIQWAMKKLIIIQLTLSVAGLIAGFALSFFIFGSKKETPTS